MITTVKLSDSIVSKAKIASKTLNRSVAEQIEHWVKIGKIVEDNPDLTYDFIKEIFAAQQEAESGQCEEYHFGKK